MIIKIAIVLLLIYIVINLVKAGFSVMRQTESSHSLSHYLGKRVLFSAIALALIILAMATGLITPNARPY